jgi:hypothetical protein
MHLRIHSLLLASSLALLIGADGPTVPDLAIVTTASAAEASGGDAGEDTAPKAPVGNWSGYHGKGVRTLLDVQPFATRTTTGIAEGPWTNATLIDLQPNVGDWFLLELTGAKASTAWHLEANGWRPSLHPAHPTGLRLTNAEDSVYDCVLFTPDAAETVLNALSERRSYVPICDGRLHVRLALEGRKTTVEWASDLLRDNFWGGEDLTVFVRDTFFRDKHLDRADLGTEVGEAKRERDGPPLPKMGADASRELAPEAFGLPTAEGPWVAGQWKPVTGQQGVFASIFQPQVVDPAVVEALGDRVRALAVEERDALVYLVAFDLEQFDISYELGTDHPRLDWSERIPKATRDDTLLGPDGFDDDGDLQRTGQVPPWRRDDLVATFTAGFKRSHGAFPIGSLSRTHMGHHYGFMSHGTVFSTLQPGLATFLIDTTGRVDLHTWSDADEASMFTLNHARQNGVPLLEPDPETGEVVAGELVSSWSGGNWASSADGNLRSLRAGFCLIEDEDKRWLVYGYFTGATPSGMAVVFKAQGCSYAMLADMNALEHTYMAIYEHDGESIQVHNLDTGMAVLDETSKTGEVLPRFVAFPDNRDFFHMVRR